MADRTEELRATAAQCLVLAQSTNGSQTRAALLIMAQKLNDMASSRPANFDMAQQELSKANVTRVGYATALLAFAQANLGRFPLAGFGFASGACPFFHHGSGNRFSLAVLIQSGHGAKRAESPSCQRRGNTDIAPKNV
jgi:hypothetical protein